MALRRLGSRLNARGGGERLMSDKFQVQDDNPNAWVGVREGFNRDTQQQVQEFIIQGKHPEDHIHLGIDMNGTEVFRSQR
jgi:hypothetical protein